MLVLFITGVLLVVIGVAVASTKYPHVDRRFRTGYKNNDLPTPGDERGIWAVLAGIVLLVAPCVAIVRFFAADQPVATAPAPVDMTVAVDLSTPLVARKKHARHKQKRSGSEFELMPDVPGTTEAVPASRDVDDDN